MSYIRVCLQRPFRKLGITNRLSILANNMSPKHKKSLHLEKPNNHLLTQSDMINPTRCLRYLTFCLTLTAGFLSVSTLLAQAPGLKLSVVSVPTATVYVSENEPNNEYPMLVLD